ncbi:phosphate ABC transporter substrate-binding protein PstS [Catellatospora chokoriensis]|uniref:Phosphate-binding protein n=1 Tax=Catellatospora chokoriensis TaxID=310353 RepID=A0A8J3JZD7_9ACTN|nr:phosphate ABC transporter substrate-binding protein PstS [Catellatospora chokoriensis]GIF87708.1 phosphate-binding protein [Catellatospora chokoriensis]
MSRLVVSLLVSAILLAQALLSGCGRAGGSPTVADAYTLSGPFEGSGASLPDAYYQAVIAAFKEVAPEATVSYDAIGSAAGKKEFAQRLTDFAGTDSAVTDTDAITPGTFVRLPTVAAPVTIAYTLAGVDGLRLRPDTIARIFQRDIRHWRDPRIVADNPGVPLPDLEITVVRRADGSGTTDNFTRYLVAAAPSWRLGSGDSIDWPAGTQAGERNTGVAGLIQHRAGSIGYLDLRDATQAGLATAAVRNRDGRFVEPTIEAATTALAAARVHGDMTYDVLDAPGVGAYPITALSYLLVRTSYGDVAKAELAKRFLTYLLNDGQALADDVSFARLPEVLRQQALAQLDKIRG